jgi:hypothetical protein
MTAVGGRHLQASILPRYLEDDLARRYRDAAPATLALLQERCNTLAGELKASESRLSNMQDVASLRRIGEALARRLMQSV